MNCQKLYFFPMFFPIFSHFWKVLWFLFSPCFSLSKDGWAKLAGSGDGFDASDSNTRGRTGHFLLGHQTLKPKSIHPRRLTAGTCAHGGLVKRS